MHQLGWLLERVGNFFDLLQKEGLPRKRGSLRKDGRRGAPILEETMHVQGKIAYAKRFCHFVIMYSVT